MNVKNITFLTQPVLWDAKLNETCAVLVTTVTFSDNRQAEVRQIIERECTVKRMADYFRAIAVGLERFEQQVEQEEKNNGGTQEGEGQGRAEAEEQSA